MHHPETISMKTVGQVKKMCGPVASTREVVYFESRKGRAAV